jgi:hypothetical protein
MNQVSGAEAQIRAKVRMVVADESLWGVLSTGERVAVALVLDRPDLLTFWERCSSRLSGSARSGHKPRCAYSVTAGKGNFKQARP